MKKLEFCHVWTNGKDFHQPMHHLIHNYKGPIYPSIFHDISCPRELLKDLIDIIKEIMKFSLVFHVQLKGPTVS